MSWSADPPASLSAILPQRRSAVRAANLAEDLFLFIRVLPRVGDQAADGLAHVSEPVRRHHLLEKLHFLRFEIYRVGFRILHVWLLLPRASSSRGGDISSP